MSDSMLVLPVDRVCRYATGALRAVGVNDPTVLPIPLADIAAAVGLQRESLSESTEEQEVPLAVQGILAKLQGPSSANARTHERTNAGLAAARSRGCMGERPPRLSADSVRTVPRPYEK